MEVALVAIAAVAVLALLVMVWSWMLVRDLARLVAGAVPDEARRPIRRVSGSYDYEPPGVLRQDDESLFARRKQRGLEMDELVVAAVPEEDERA